jgi:hypothetical protein
VSLGLLRVANVGHKILYELHLMPNPGTSKTVCAVRLDAGIQELRGLCEAYGDLLGGVGCIVAIPGSQ